MTSTCDGFSKNEDELVRLHQFYCQHHLCQNKCSTSPSVTPVRLQGLKSIKISHFPNITIKWKGNNRKICTIIFIILQLLLTLALLGKISILKINKTKIHQNFTEASMETKSFPFVVLNDDSHIAITEQQIHSLQIKTRSNPKTRENECLPVEASSEDEYQLKMSNISDQTTVCLTVNFHKDIKWNLENSSPQTDIVKELILVGSADMIHLSTVLERFNYAYKITFGQTSNQFGDKNNNQCIHREMQESYPTEKYLLNLNELIIENIDCTHIFDFLSKTFYMNAVRSLEIRNTEITRNNIMGIRHLLKQYKYSLESLHFTDVLWKVSLFDRISNQLPNLNELYIDLLAPVNTNIEFLRGFNGANHFLKIVSMRGYLPYSQFSPILKFKMLSNVTLGVDIPNNVTKLDLCPVNVLPNLRYMELFLNFRNISTCYLLSDYDIERPYVTKINSNCDEDF